MEILELYRQFCPYPSVDSEYKFYEGLLFSHPRVCQKCKKIKCWEALPSKLGEDISHLECHIGLSLIPVKLETGIILINGVIESLLNKTCPPHIRKENRSHKVLMENVRRWHSLISDVKNQIDAVISKNVAEAIASLHDIKTATNLVFRNAEALIAQVSGETDEERIENADPSLKSLYKSVSLLNTRLNMSSIAANPQAASFGSRRPAPVYKIFDKMCRLFEEIAGKKSVRIYLYGASYNKVQCYDSFENLALVLLDNAVKYSMNSEVINVNVNDVGRGVEVRVESRGPVIPEGEREQIFEKGYRTSAAKKVASGGSGLGLYIAKNIAEAHGFKIQYEVRNPNPKGDIGTNIFYFRLDS
jgi:signal transduction histidine kinase